MEVYYCLIWQWICDKCSVLHFVYNLSSDIHTPHISSGVPTQCSSGGSCSYSSVGPSGGGWCTVCSHLAPAEVSSSLQ